MEVASIPSPAERRRKKKEKKIKLSLITSGDSSPSSPSVYNVASPSLPQSPLTSAPFSPSSQGSPASPLLMSTKSNKSNSSDTIGGHISKSPTKSIPYPSRSKEFTPTTSPQSSSWSRNQKGNGDLPSHDTDGEDYSDHLDFVNTKASDFEDDDNNTGRTKENSTRNAESIGTAPRPRLRQSLSLIDYAFKGVIRDYQRKKQAQEQDLQKGKGLRLMKTSTTSSGNGGNNGSSSETNNVTLGNVRSPSSTSKYTQQQREQREQQAREDRIVAGLIRIFELQYKKEKELAAQKRKEGFWSPMRKVPSSSSSSTPPLSTSQTLPSRGSSPSPLLSTTPTSYSSSSSSSSLTSPKKELIAPTVHSPSASVLSFPSITSFFQK